MDQTPLTSHEEGIGCAPTTLLVFLVSCGLVQFVISDQVGALRLDRGFRLSMLGGLVLLLTLTWVRRIALNAATTRRPPWWMPLSRGLFWVVLISAMLWLAFLLAFIQPTEWPIL